MCKEKREREKGNYLTHYFPPSVKAAPVVSAILSLLNDVRLAAKKPLLGYVTPLIYNPRVRSAFVPISTGPTNTAGSCQGFQPDVNGAWSPIVGFGGINFQAMSRLI